MKLATTLFVLGVIAVCLGLAILLAKIILKIVAAKKAKKTDATPTPTPVDTETGDDTNTTDDTNTDDNGDGTSDETSDEAKACVCTEKGALAKAEAAEAEAAKAKAEAEAAKAAAEAAKAQAEATAKSVAEMQHQERLAKNAENIRLVEGELALKRSELADAKEALHFANDDQIDLGANAKAANMVLVKAGSAKNNASHKYAAAVEAKSAAEIAVANATLENAGEDVLTAADADYVLATENANAAFAELQAAIDALNKAKAAKTEADKAVEAKSNEIEAIKAKIAKLEEQIVSLEKKLAELNA